MNPYYTDYSEYLSRYFGKRKIQKISVNTGHSCPNRDGKLGTGGCIYCNNKSFTPGYCFDEKSIKAQIEEGKKFFRRKYPEMGFLVYFQSFTSTHGAEASVFEKNCEELLCSDDICGLVVSTRPDCLDDEMIRSLSSLNRIKPVFIEIGVESMHDSTLEIINRRHNSQQVEACVAKLSRAGLDTGVHLIAGLPGEDEGMMLETIKRIGELDVKSIKLHHLQILEGTRLYEMWKNGELKIKPWEMNDYLDFCVKVVDLVPRHIAIERFLSSAPLSMVIAPKWGIKNYEFTNLLINKLRKKAEK